MALLDMNVETLMQLKTTYFYMFLKVLALVIIFEYFPVFSLCIDFNIN